MILKLATAVLVVLGLAAPGVAHADTTLSPAEITLANSISGGVCDFLDEQDVNTTSLTALLKTIYRSPIVPTYDDSVAIINYDVYNYCPRHWGELVAFGEGARSSHV